MLQLSKHASNNAEGNQYKTLRKLLEQNLTGMFPLCYKNSLKSKKLSSSIPSFSLASFDSNSSIPCSPLSSITHFFSCFFLFLFTFSFCFLTIFMTTATLRSSSSTVATFPSQLQQILFLGIQQKLQLHYLVINLLLDHLSLD
ncbi:hypothetical protein HPP92_019325 [Vanilla planifolia]|uniref:Uncharacterized protein n=1 Tax=Vanilla planifolia TaxID=51239 RepID=A0A835UL12_VANPL|nr:hypothetical protein HPP92_019325 [Vanilla planifolia]